MKTLDDYIQSIEDKSKNLEILPTGFPSVDKILDGGLMRKELVILGGFTGLGKSYVAGQMAWNIATKGFKTAYFSLEISGEMIVSRLIGSICNIKPTLIVRNNFNEAEKEKVDDAKMDVSMYSELVHIYDDVYELDKIAAIILKGKYDFVVIDFIQNIMSKGDEYERMSEISLNLQRLAKTANCCILTLSQLSNSAAKNGDLEYKGSGGIAMVADLGFFLVRKDKEKNGNPNDLWLALRKNRRGFSGTDHFLTFDIPGGKIYEK